MSLPELKHLEGMPPFLMMQIEARLKVRIRELLQAEAWRKINLAEMVYLNKDQTIGIFEGKAISSRVDEKEICDFARQMLHWMMEKRINEGKQFDSILAASTKAFGHMMINQVLRPE